MREVGASICCDMQLSSVFSYSTWRAVYGFGLKFLWKVVKNYGVLFVLLKLFHHQSNCWVELSLCVYLLLLWFRFLYLFFTIISFWEIFLYFWSHRVILNQSDNSICIGYYFNFLNLLFWPFFCVVLVLKHTELLLLHCGVSQSIHHKSLK